MLHIGPWLWGDKYPAHYVDRLRAGVARHLTLEHQFRIFTPEPEDEHLTKVQGCFARLRAFDPAWQGRQGIAPGDRIVTLDLDLVVTGNLDPLGERPEPFGILANVNTANPCWANGSVWWTTAGYRPDVWSDFSVEAADALPGIFAFADDQLWLANKLPDAGRIGPEAGFYAFCKVGWPKGNALPADARLVAFPGWRDPSKFAYLGWIKEHWR